MSRSALLPVTAVLLAGCATSPAGPAAAPSTPAEQRYAVSATVLESPAHGPQLCSAVAESYPPQCGGPDVLGWDWAQVDGEESAGGTTWGEYRVVGTWDGDALELTEPPGEPRYDEGDAWPEQDLSTRCPTPPGGWGIEDPATATAAGREAAIGYASARPDLGAVWLDSGARLADRLPGVPEQAVLNASFTGDVEEHEAAMRARYGGPLCVSAADVSQAEVSRLQERVGGLLRGEMLSSGRSVEPRVWVLVPVVDDALRARVAAVDPDGHVGLRSWLQPVG